MPGLITMLGVLVTKVDLLRQIKRVGLVLKKPLLP